MIAFARGEHDVLVCTTIIESGLDIPNANTIVILASVVARQGKAFAMNRGDMKMMRVSPGANMPRQAQWIRA